MIEALKQWYLEKRECVIQFPDWLLSGEKIKALREKPRLAIVEIAGRDSIAAAVKGSEEKGFSDLLPTYAYTGTEHGNLDSVVNAVMRLSKRLQSVKVHDLLLMGSPGFWRALNGRFVRELISRYGFYTPCVGCHLYLHSIRIPLSLLLGNVPILAGERETHDGVEKVNQSSLALQAYKDLAKVFGVSLLLPLRHLDEGKEVEDILGFSWNQDEEQLGCVLSGNYRKIDGSFQQDDMSIGKFLNEFAVPLSRRVIQTYNQGLVPDHLALAAEMLHA